MVKLYKSVCLGGKAFESDDHMRNWLIRVTINMCKSVLRSFGRSKCTSIEELAEAGLSNPDASEESELFQAVMSLPEQHRTVLYLYYYEDLTTKEIAGILNQKEAHVRTRVSRARKKLKEVWKDE
jgi:RNA polymerase sigma-70 factor (ECF subfamily)